MYTLIALVAWAPERRLVLPFASRVKTMPGTASANCRKLREDWGVASIWRSDTVLPTSDVFTSCKAVAVTVTAPRLVALAAAGALVLVAAVRFRVAVDATLSVTVCVVPGPASTVYVPGGRPTSA